MRWLGPSLLLSLALPQAGQATLFDDVSPADHFHDREDLDGVGLLKSPHFGRSRVAVLMILPPGEDTAGWQDYLRQYYEAPRDQPGFRHFYYVNSNGRYDPEATVLPPLVLAACPLGGEGDPADPENPCPFGLGADAWTDILLDILATFEREQGPVDWRQFDANGPDGKPDGVLDGLILQGYVQFQFMDRLPDGVTLFFDPQTLPDGTMLTSAGIVIGLADSFNTAVHEFGHVLGLSDTKRWGDQGSLMAYGQGALGAVDRVNLGWSELRIIEGEGDYLFPPSLESGVVYRAGQWPEYWLIENRRPLAGIEDEEKHFGDPHLRLGLHVTQVNLRPDAEVKHRYDLDSYGLGIASGLLPGQEMMSVPAGSIATPEDLHGNTNYSTGEPSGLTITGIDYSGDYSPCGLPYMKAHIVPPNPPSDAPSLDVECRATGDCSGTRVCRDAQCVEPPEALPRLTLESFEPYCVEKSPVPEESSGGGDTGCSCRAVDTPPSPGMALWLGLGLWAFRRRKAQL